MKVNRSFEKVLVITPREMEALRVSAPIHHSVLQQMIRTGDAVVQDQQPRTVPQ